MDSSAAQTPHNHHMRPTQVLALGFLAVILVGTALLCLPISSADGKPLPLLSALFTATTSTCVTGLTVVETGLAFSHFGPGCYSAFDADRRPRLHDGGLPALHADGQTYHTAGTPDHRRGAQRVLPTGPWSAWSSGWFCSPSPSRPRGRSYSPSA